MKRPASKAFTLVELLVSLSILTLLLLVLVGITNQTSEIWHRTTAKTEQFREARAAFETMTTRLSQATLNAYWDYDNALAPTKYQRRSELRFIAGPANNLTGSVSLGANCFTHCVFFEGPFGITATPAGASGAGLKYGGFENLLCTWGYYLAYDPDLTIRPQFLTGAGVPPRYRFRLMELMQPSEQNFIYSYAAAGKAASYTGLTWVTDVFTAAQTSQPPLVHLLAENVIALIITPRLSTQDEAAIKGIATPATADLSPLAPNYLYDTSPLPSGATGDARYSDPRLDPVSQLPPLLQVTMVAIDEGSAVRLNLGAAATDVFQVQTKFKNSADYSKDLYEQTPGGTAPNASSLESTLIQQHINYRIFNTNVTIRGAKWSREQTN